MKKICLFLFLIFNFTTVNAQTYFEVVRDIFYQGEKPEVEEIQLTPWTGRCFRRENPNAPMNIGLYVREKSVVDDAGPISLRVFEISNYTFHNRPANFLDDKDHDYLAPFIEPLYENLNTNLREYTFFNRQSGRALWAYLRKNENYLVQLFYDQYGREANIRCYYWPVINLE